MRNLYTKNNGKVYLKGESTLEYAIIIFFIILLILGIASFSCGVFSLICTEILKILGG